MPLLHRDASRGGGGSRENRRSMAEILSFDASLFANEAAAPRPSRVNGQDDIWRWEPPGSPEAAQSPRTLVPASCFPPQHPSGFGSFSESARPGSWAADNLEGMPELVASFNAMSASSNSARRNHHSFRSGVSYEPLDREQEASPADGSAPAQQRALTRRASFSGVVETAPKLVRWSGVLAPRCMEPNPPGGYSAKVFMGGLPWDMSEEALLEALHQFHPIRVEWPGREAAPRGFAYVTLESERHVRALLGAARRAGRKWLLRVASRSQRSKDAEVIPWAVADSDWVLGGERGVRLQPERTVFVGALHGVLSAAALAQIMNDLFAGVVYAGIDTDKSKYPIGSGRVTFDNMRSYVAAISAAFVEIQVDPYLEDSMCSVCNLQQGPYFCRDPQCFCYFCRTCWGWKHQSDSHKALMRNSKNGNVQPSGVGGSVGSVGRAVGQPPGGEHSHSNGYAQHNDATPSPPPSGGEAEEALPWNGV
ncbi:cytoplasmic polyadenylation element-binding protein 1-B isoform X2 [Bicyclus anynana]|uniref:Cytoplasmic polyadenylation element-binding protein 1-B isoform X2 n=1 Tax=Bicyclus anynana TaxID=110368 RepID=A0A6J1MHU8_BICAN|nr:cytoplasmic polyadenylation element-binding protein 1-B isoform X2 [Bicyclus anynana]